MLPPVIGITGRKRSGKDALGGVFVTLHGYERIAFADALKDACAVVFGFSAAQLHGDEKEIPDPFWHVTPRAVLQFVGTELFRDRMPALLPDMPAGGIWVEVVRRKIAAGLAAGKRFVVTDVRFPNEMQMVADFGGIGVRVRRDRDEHSAADASDRHESESFIDTLPVRADIKNNGTLQDLYDEADRVCDLQPRTAADS